MPGPFREHSNGERVRGVWFEVIRLLEKVAVTAEIRTDWKCFAQSIRGQNGRYAELTRIVTKGNRSLQECRNSCVVGEGKGTVTVALPVGVACTSTVKR